MGIIAAEVKQISRKNDSNKNILHYYRNINQCSEALPALGWEVQTCDVPQGNLRGDSRTREAVGSRSMIDGRPRPSAAPRTGLPSRGERLSKWMRIESTPHRVAPGVIGGARSQATAPPVYGWYRPWTKRIPRFEGGTVAKHVTYPFG